MNEKIKSLIDVCHNLHATGMVSGSGGNVSVYDSGKMYITPTGVSLGEVSEENIVCVNVDDGTYSGDIRPSKEYIMHMECYRNRPDITAVVHVHSVYAVAMSCVLNPGDRVPVYFPGYAMRVGYLPLIQYYRPGSKELADDVGEIIKIRNSVMLCNHGVVTVGKDMSQALNIMEEIEENAKLYFIMKDHNGRTLTEEQVREINPDP